MHLADRPGPCAGCHRLDKSLAVAHNARRKPLPPYATATLMEAPPVSRRSAAAPSRAVIIGGSVAGLLSAAAASPFFDEVVVLERDPPMPPRSDKLQADGEEYKAMARSRNGSPQFMHGHIYLKRGWEVANEFLPGLEDVAIAGGATVVNALRDTKSVTGGFTLEPAKDAVCDLSWVQATRFVAERAFRERLLALYGNVQLRSNCWVTGLEHGDGDARGAVTGVAVKGGEVLEADMVVDASGRLSRVQSWLTEGGYDTPRSVEINPRIGYATAVFSVPEEVIHQLGWKCLYVRPVAPETRGGLCMLIEGGRMQIGGVGYGGDHPPGDLPGLIEFLDSLRVPDISNLMRHATPLFDPISYKGATNKRRFYEEVTLPRNLVVLGDSVCTFNPAYGQGITTAALHAQALQKQLQACAQSSFAPLRLARLGNISAKAQKDIADVSAFCFDIATSEDLKYPTTKGERTNSPAQRFLADYVQDMLKCSVDDPEVGMVYSRVSHMVSPPETLFAPQILGKVAMYRMRQLLGQLAPRQDASPAPYYIE